MNYQENVPAGKRTDLLTGCAAGLFVLYLAEVVLGSVLELQYKASATSAYSSVRAMNSQLRAFHYWSSSLLIAGTLAVLVWMVVARKFEDANRRTWFAVGLLFLSSLLGQITGNLLPFDRHGVQTAVVESGVARQMPIVGSMTAKVILGGDQFNEGTVARWHVGHMGLVVLGLAACFLFWSGTRGQRKGGALVWAPLGLAILACLVAAPLGNQATAADYGLFDAQVSWYTWPLHGSLNLFAKLSSGLGWIGSGVIPTLFALLIPAAPFASRRLPAKVIQVLFFAFFAYFLGAAVFFGGRFAPLVGNRDPASVTVSQPTNPGKVDPALYAQGRQLFNGNPCVNCHGRDGRTASMGPNLLGVAQRRGTDPNWYVKFIKDPASVNPNSTMPAFPNLTQAQTRAIAEFLIYQKP